MNGLIDFFVKNKPLSKTMTASSVLLFRLFAGLMMLPYGIGKIQNFEKYSVDFFGDPIGIGMLPSLILTIFAQVVCSLTLTLGLFSRFSASVLAINMLVAVKYHWNDDFATLSLPLLFFGIYCFLILSGGEKYSVDTLMFNKNKK